MTRALLALLLVTGCAAQQHYDRFEHYATGVLTVVSVGATVCDYGQTTHMSHNGRWDWGITEANPFMGSTPNTATIAAFHAAGIGGAILGARTLPRGLRLVFAVAYAGFNVLNVSDQGENPAHPRRLCGYR